MLDFHKYVFVIATLLVNSATAGEIFTTEGCDYSVEFPGKPEVTTAFMPEIGEFEQVVYGSYASESNMYFLKYECIYIGDTDASGVNDKEFLQSRIVDYAVKTGFQTPIYKYADNELGKHVSVRGTKLIAGRYMTYESFIYIGKNSILNIYTGGFSEYYPHSEVYKYTNSVIIK